MRLRDLPALGLLALTAAAQAGQVPSGVWKQTSSTAGDCPSCEITITRVTPHIIRIAGSNRWQAFAHYSEKEDKYRGALEWEAGAGNHYEGIPFMIELAFEEKTLRLDASSTRLSFTATYQQKARRR